MPEAAEEQQNHSGLQNLFGQEDKHGALPLENIRARARRQLTKFGALVHEELENAGINCPPAISLVGTPEHMVTLDNHHPQGEAITKWLSGNVKLAKKFKEVEVLFEIVRAAENAGTTFPKESRFHVGFTSAGPVAYFQEQSGDPPQSP
jgi:hypothetical protein